MNIEDFSMLGSPNELALDQYQEQPQVISCGDEQQYHMVNQQLSIEAEAYNHSDKFANICNTHGAIHYILPNTFQSKEYDLMSDSMHYEEIMPEPPQQTSEPEVTHLEEAKRAPFEKRLSGIE